MDIAGDEAAVDAAAAGRPPVELPPGTQLSPGAMHAAWRHTCRRERRMKKILYVTSKPENSDDAACVSRLVQHADCRRCKRLRLTATLQLRLCDVSYDRLWRRQALAAGDKNNRLAQLSTDLLILSIVIRAWIAVDLRLDLFSRNRLYISHCIGSAVDCFCDWSVQRNQ